MLSFKCLCLIIYTHEIYMLECICMYSIRVKVITNFIKNIYIYTMLKILNINIKGPRVYFYI